MAKIVTPENEFKDNHVSKLLQANLNDMGSEQRQVMLTISYGLLMSKETVFCVNGMAYGINRLLEDCEKENNKEH